MNIVFFGSSKHSLPVVRALFEHPDYEISAIVSQPTRPVGKKRVLAPTPVSEFAKTHNIPLFTPKTLTDYRLPITDYRLIIVAAYGLLLPKKLLDLPKYGALNIHPSLLPEYRGSSPAQWAILEGRKKTGVTIIKMSKQFDKGEIVAQKEIPILPTDNGDILYDRAFRTGSQLLIEILPDYIQGKIKLKVQPKDSPTVYARKLTREDGCIDWSKSDLEIERMIRAFDPWPGAWTTIAELCSAQGQKAPKKTGQAPGKRQNDKRRIKILKAHLNSFGKLQIDKLQIEGKKPISWEEFVKGYGIENF